MLNRNEAMALLNWANGLNPGPWRAHSLNAARAAEAIAAACGMDADKAWVMGALHDIGRFEGPRGIHHIVAGYNLLMEKGEAELARICMTHSFPDRDTRNYIGKWDVTDGERAFIEEFIPNCAMDDYDRLIQLCDALALAEGICLIEKRLIDVALRHGVPPTIPEKWRKTMEIRAGFEAKMGNSVYNLFEDVIANTFPGVNFEMMSN